MSTYLTKDLLTLEDENNPSGSQADLIYPTTIIDQVFDNASNSNKSLRTILEEIRQEIITGGQVAITFPVTSVNDQMGDVVITKEGLGLGNVDNTRDYEKPFSDLQRAGVMDILEHYEFHVDLTDLYNHIAATNNPHGVTFDQINTNNIVGDYIENYINNHNHSNDCHSDIRTSIHNTNERINEITSYVDNKCTNVITLTNIHYTDPSAHVELFEEKEDISNKIIEITDELKEDTVKYTSPRAVVDYVSQQMDVVRDEIPKMDNWLEDVGVVSSRMMMPAPEAKYIHTLYFIRNNNQQICEIAVCKKNPNGRYGWQYHEFLPNYKYDNTYFNNISGEITLNTDPIAHEIVNNEEIVNFLRNAVTSASLQDYYTKNEIDSMHHVDAITIVPGTDNGSIRYYINNDQSTMSDNIMINGLNRLAFLDRVTENEIRDQSVDTNHIVDGAIENRHIANHVVDSRTIKCTYNSILGNFSDHTGKSAEDVSLETLAELLYPKLKEIEERNQSSP